LIITKPSLGKESKVLCNHSLGKEDLSEVLDKLDVIEPLGGGVKELIFHGVPFL